MMRTPEKSVAYTPVFSTKNKCIYNNNNNNNNNSDLKLIKSDFCDDSFSFLSCVVFSPPPLPLPSSSCVVFFPEKQHV